MDLLGLAAKFATATTEIDGHMQRSVVKSATIIQESAKSAIGTYEFGWPSLAESTIERKANGDTPLLETGALRDSIVQAVGHHEAWVGTNDPKAAWMEHGTSKAPPRPFIMGAVTATQEQVTKLFGDSIRKTFAGRQSRTDD